MGQTFDRLNFLNELKDHTDIEHGSFRPAGDETRSKRGLAAARTISGSGRRVNAKDFRVERFYSSVTNSESPRVQILALRSQRLAIESCRWPSRKARAGTTHADTTHAMSDYRRTTASPAARTIP